jgi:hypothetical protein
MTSSSPQWCLSMATRLDPSACSIITIMSTSSATSAAPTSFASLISNPRRVEDWKRLEDYEPLSTLKIKFWGKEMPGEEKVLRDKLQSTSSSSDLEREDDDINGEEESGYVLDITSDVIEMDQILVRVSVSTTGGSTVFTNLAG